jgi:choloylglycine hydrolase
MRRCSLVWSLGLLLCSLGGVAGCSYFELPLPSGALCCGRTMELGGHGHHWRVKKHRRKPLLGRALGFVSIEYSSNVSSAAAGLNLTLDFVAAEGMNEAGLTLSAQTARFSEYQQQPAAGEAAAGAVEAVLWIELVPWALARFDSVAALLAGLAGVRVVEPAAALVPSGDKLHWAAADGTGVGGSVVLEYVGGALVVHNNSAGVMTNDPPLPWHLTHLDGFAGVGSGAAHYPTSDPELMVDTAEAGRLPVNVGHGYNLALLPGDLSPPARFVRLFFLKQIALQQKPLPTAASQEAEAEAAALTLATGLINGVHIIEGTVARSSAADPAELTQYAVVKFPASRRFVLRSYDNMQWRLLDLAALDFGSESSFALNNGVNGVANVTAELMS